MGDGTGENLDVIALVGDDAPAPVVLRIGCTPIPAVFVLNFVNGWCVARRRFVGRTTGTQRKNQEQRSVPNTACLWSGQVHELGRRSAAIARCTDPVGIACELVSIHARGTVGGAATSRNTNL